jgi:hypothetical protein
VSDIEAIEALLAKATPGPWGVDGNGPWKVHGHHCAERLATFHAPDDCEGGSAVVNAMLAVSLVNVAPSLIAEMRRLRAEVNRLRAESYEPNMSIDL